MKKIIYFVVIILLLFIINNFFHSIYSLWQKQDLITEARNDLAQARPERKTLEQELQKVQESTYIEEEARNKLFLVKPGEQVVVLPEVSTQPEAASREEEEPEPAWLQWYKLFF